MASVIKGKIKRYPSGLTSVVFSHIPVSVSGSSGDKVVGCEAPFPDFETGEIVAHTKDAPLAVVPKFGKQSEPKAGWGGLGNKSKASWKSCREVREIMASCELEFGKENSWLLTVTQPSVDKRAYEGLARYSSYAMDRLNRELNRYFAGYRLGRVSVWEYQKRGSLHCHILLSSDCIHAKDVEQFRLHICKVWYRILLAISKKFECNPVLSSTGKDWSLEQLSKLRSKKEKGVFVDCQVIKHSIVAYLSKYLADSNHEDDGKKNKQKLRESNYPVATWFQWNRLARSLYEKYMDEFEIGECEPDKKNVLIKKVKDFAQSVTSLCKKGTEIKHSKNPYNVGFYLIPDIEKCEELAEKTATFIEKISVFFREKVVKVKSVFAPKSLENLPFIGVDLDTELTVREYERQKRISSRLLSVTSAKDMYNLGQLMLSLLDSLDSCLDGFNPPENYTQMELDYGLEKARFVPIRWSIFFDESGGFP